jgi:hypothetical protein
VRAGKLPCRRQFVDAGTREDALFLEHPGGIVLDVEAGATVADFLRAFVHPKR